MKNINNSTINIDNSYIRGQIYIYQYNRLVMINCDFNILQPLVAAHYIARVPISVTRVSVGAFIAPNGEIYGRISVDGNGDFYCDLGTSKTGYVLSILSYFTA